MRIIIAVPLLLAMAFGFTGTSLAANCMGGACEVGEKVTTQASQRDKVYNCPTQGLAEYTNFILGIWAMQAEIAGIKPNADIEKTATGQTAQFLAMYRKEAKVKTFNEAIALCAVGKSGIKGKVSSRPKDSFVIMVEPENGLPHFWTSEGHLVRSK